MEVDAFATEIPIYLGTIENRCNVLTIDIFQTCISVSNETDIIPAFKEKIIKLKSTKEEHKKAPAFAMGGNNNLSF